MENHLKLRAAGELDRDLEENYDPEVVVLTARKVYRGHDGVRESGHLLWKAVSDEHAYQYDSVLVEDRIALLEWQAKTDDLHVNCGVDSYLIEDGVIKGQTIHYKVESLELSVAASTLAEPGERGPTSSDDETRLHHLVNGSGED
jgi:hypothetical protein